VNMSLPPSFRRRENALPAMKGQKLTKTRKSARRGKGLFQRLRGRG
jgi:hypothetical protein